MYPDILYMKDRITAFSIHLSLSSVIALLAIILVFQLWYPSPLHDLIGVDTIFYTIVIIDIIIGPVLTFVVFNREKPHLKLDLTIIAFIQISALVYGIWTVALGRPAWIVFNVDRFDLVQAQEIDSRQREKSARAYKTAPLFGPRWVSAEAPKNIDDYNTLTFESVFAGIDLPQRTDLYQPISNAHEKISERAISLDNLAKYNSAQAVKDVLTRWPQANAYLPLYFKTRSAVVLLDTESDQIIGISGLSPW